MSGEQKKFEIDGGYQHIVMIDICQVKLKRKRDTLKKRQIDNTGAGLK